MHKESNFWLILWMMMIINLSIPSAAWPDRRCASIFTNNFNIKTININNIPKEVWRSDEPVRIQVLVNGQSDVTIGRATFSKKGDALYYHKHAHPEFYQVLKGHGEVIISGVKYKVSAGDVVILPGNAYHDIRNISDKPLEIEYYFPATSLADVNYIFNSPTTEIALTQKQLIFPIDAISWQESEFPNIMTRDVVNSESNLNLQFSQWFVDSSQKIEGKITHTDQIISVLEGVIEITIGKKSKRVRKNEIVIVPAYTKFTLSKISRIPVIFGIISRLGV